MKKPRTFGIARILLISVALVILLVTIVVTAMSNNSYRNMVRTLYTERLVGLAKIADGIFKRANVDKYLSGAPIDNTFNDMKEQLRYIVKSTSIEQIALIRRGPNGNSLFLVSTSNDEPFRIVDVSWAETFEDYEEEDADVMIGVDTENMIVSLARNYYDDEGDYSGLISISTNYEAFMDEVEDYRNRTVVVVLLTVAVIIFLYSAYLSRFLISPIKEITAEALRFPREKNHKAHSLAAADRGDELGVLAKTITKMEKDILKYIDDLTEINREKNRVVAELNIAARIQTGMLTTETFPDRKEFEVCASMTPAREVGGDFYDYFFIDPTHLAVVVADVSGKGIPAALFMMVSQMLIRQILTDNPRKKPSEVLMGMDQIFSKRNSTEQFVTVWLGILDVKSGHVIASNAGHEFPVISQGEGNSFIAMKDKHNPPVATMEGIQRADYTFTLRDGDSLLLYTDGVLEATDANEKMYGMERLLEVLNTKKESTPQDTVKCVLDSVNSFVGKAEQFDDLTLVNLMFHC